MEIERERPFPEEEVCAPRLVVEVDGPQAGVPE
jgi:hypothetical protein